MIWFLVFYYVFSLLFMIGYVDFGDLGSGLVLILGIIALLILSPIMLPINIGYAVSRIE